MEVSWHMWKTNKDHLHKKTMINILKKLCTAKGITTSTMDMEHVIINSKSYRYDEKNNVYFASSHFKAFFLAKRLYLTLRKVKMKAIYKLFNTRCYDNDVLYFLSMLDQNTNCIYAPLQSILRKEYVENVTENALHIYCTTAQFKKDFQIQQAKGFPNITHYNLTQNLGFSLEVKNNTFNSDNNSRSESFFEQGLQLLKDNKNFEALEPFFAAKALDPNCIKAANNLAIAFKNLGSVSIARKMVQNVLLEEPDNYRAKQHLKYLENFENQQKQLTGGAHE